MDDRPSGQRIEIELTEHADTSGGARRRRARTDEPPGHTPSSVSGAPTAVPSDAVVAVGSTGGQAGGQLSDWGTERRRLVVTALAAAVVALFIGWALGRSGGSGSEEASGADEGSETVEVTSADDSEQSTPGAALPSVAPDDLPTTTRPFTPIVEAGPTTTTLPRWEPTTFEIDPAVLGADVQMVALTRTGLVDVDLTSGEGRSIRTRAGAFNDGQPQQLFAGRDWTLVHTPDRPRSQLFEGDAPPEQIQLDASYQIYLEPGSDLLTAVEQTSPQPESSTSTWEIRQLPHDGSPALSIATIELPGFVWVQAVDPLGGVIVGGPSGGVYRIGADGVSTRLTTGQLYSVSATRLVISECGETLDTCALVVVDRATGDRRLLPAEDEKGIYQPTYGWFGSMPTSVSPTGELATVIRAGSSSYELGLLSLSDGSFRPLTGNFNDAMVTWSADGRYAFYVQGGLLYAYDTTTDTEAIVSDDIREVIAVTARPAA